MIKRTRAGLTAADPDMGKMSRSEPHPTKNRGRRRAIALPRRMNQAVNTTRWPCQLPRRIEQDAQRSSLVPQSDTRGLHEAPYALLVQGLESRPEDLQGHGAIHGAGIHMHVAQPSGNKLRRRALS